MTQTRLAAEPRPAGEDAEPDRAPLPLAIVETVLIVLGLAALAYLLPHKITSDGEGRYQALTQLLTDGTLSDNRFSLVGPLFATPLWLLGQVAKTREFWIQQYNVVLFGLGLLATWALLRRRVDPDLLRRFLLLMTAGSMVGAHVTDFYGEIFTAVTVGVGVLASLAPRVRAAGWVALVLGTANTPASLVGLAFVSARRVMTSRRVRYAGAVLLAGVIIAGEAWLRRGSPFADGQEKVWIARTVMPYSGRPGFSYPFLLGVLAILFSFGKGLVFYLPGLLLPARRKLRERSAGSAVDLAEAYLLWLCFLAGLVVIYASWWSWYGGMYWGPRFFLVGIFPAALALAANLQHRRASLLANLATLGVLVLSGWIGASSTVYQGTLPWTCYENGFALEALCHFTPEFSPLWYPFIADGELTGKQQLYLAYFVVVFAVLAGPLLARIVSQLQDRWETAWPQLRSGWRW